MHDTCLNDGFGEDGVERLRETFQTIDDGDQDVGDAALLELIQPKPIDMVERGRESRTQWMSWLPCFSAAIRRIPAAGSAATTS